MHFTIVQNAEIILLWIALPDPVDGQALLVLPANAEAVGNGVGTLRWNNPTRWSDVVMGLYIWEAVRDIYGYNKENY